MKNLFRGFKEHKATEDLKMAEEQKQREERLRQLEEESQNRRGLHILNPIRSVQNKREMKNLLKEITTYEEKKKEKKTTAILIGVIVVCFALLGVMALKEKNDLSENNQQNVAVTSSQDSNINSNEIETSLASDSPKEFSEKEINEMLVGTKGKTAFEAMKLLEETGFTFKYYNDGELSNFDSKAYYLKQDAELLSYECKEIAFLLLPADMYQYYCYEERLSKVWDIVEIGIYEQDGNTSNGKEPIRWLVLETDESRQLLCSLYILDRQKYNGTSTNPTSATWESSYLRSWLNEIFINEAFTQDEKSAIVVTSVETEEKNISCESLGVNITQDKVFLLSYDEVEFYFENKSLRQAMGTNYAKLNKLFVSDKTGMSHWWLRTPESDIYKFVINSKGLHENSPRVNESSGIRPVLWVDMALLKQ